MKLKGIDGGPHKRWSMWVPSKISFAPWLMVLLELQQIQLNHSSEIPKIHLGNQIYLCLSEYALKI